MTKGINEFKEGDSAYKMLVKKAKFFAVMLI